MTWYVTLVPYWYDAPLVVLLGWHHVLHAATMWWLAADDPRTSSHPSPTYGGSGLRSWAAGTIAASTTEQPGG